MLNIILSLLMMASAQENKSCTVDQEKSAQFLNALVVMNKYCVMPLRHKVQTPNKKDVYETLEPTDAAVTAFIRHSQDSATKIYQNNYLVAARLERCQDYKESLEIAKIKFEKAYDTKCAGYKELMQEVTRTNKNLEAKIATAKLILEANSKLATQITELSTEIGNYYKDMPMNRNTAAK